MRSKGIIHTLVVAALVLFMGAFILQHTGVLAQSGDRDPPRHKQLVAHTSRAITLSGGVAPLRARSGHVAAAVPSGPIPALAMPELGRVLFVPTFSSRTVLVTNDYAYFNPDSPRAVHSADWIVTSGSLFARDRAGWTGAPDSVRPNANSSNGTDSATFRAVTRRRDFGNVAVSFDLLTLRYVSTTRTPAHEWDGVHVFLHYRSQRSLYVLTLNRRDNRVLVKKKRPGGPANGGTYYTLGPAVTYRPALGHWQHVLATIRSNANHTVTISAYVNGRLRLSTTDTGAGGSVLSEPGAVGLRGDNAEFEFSHFRVSELR